VMRRLKSIASGRTSISSDPVSIHFQCLSFQDQIDFIFLIVEIFLSFSSRNYGLMSFIVCYKSNLSF